MVNDDVIFFLFSLILSFVLCDLDLGQDLDSDSEQNYE